MSYYEKYLKYKNKYLALKAKYGHLLTNKTGGDALFDELNVSETPINNLNLKIVSMNGGGDDDVTQTEVTVKLENSESLTSLFSQDGGAKKSKSKSKNNKAKKHFFADDSDLSKSTSTSSEANSDSDFSSSDTDW